MSRWVNIVFVWEQFGPYHIDRCNAVARAWAGQRAVIGIELVERSADHLWDRPPAPTEFRLVTLFKGAGNSRRQLATFLKLLRAALRARPAICFVAHYERWPLFLTSAALRLLGVRLIVAIDSKFDDKPRHLHRELLKSFFFLPYSGALVSGARAQGYMEFFGFKPNKIATGYDTLSMERMADGQASAPDGHPYAQRSFTIIARFVEKKNLSMAIDAYARYCELAGPHRRELHICGDGHMRTALEAQVAKANLAGVHFQGVVQPDLIPSVLARSLALILPSTEEQWGLVANEAIALGVPLLLSTNCGARDTLLQTGVSGFIYEPDNPTGLAFFMHLLGGDEALWRRMCEASRALRPLADTRRFQEAVASLLRSPRSGCRQTAP